VNLSFFPRQAGSFFNSSFFCASSLSFVVAGQDFSCTPAYVLPGTVKTYLGKTPLMKFPPPFSPIFFPVSAPLFARDNFLFRVVANCSFFSLRFLLKNPRVLSSQAFLHRHLSSPSSPSDYEPPLLFRPSCRRLNLSTPDPPRTLFFSFLFNSSPLLTFRSARRWSLFLMSIFLF